MTDDTDSKAKAAVLTMGSIIATSATLALQILVPVFVALFLSLIVVFTVGFIIYATKNAILGFPGFVMKLVFGPEREQHDEELEDPVDVPIPDESDDYVDVDIQDSCDDDRDDRPFWRTP